MSLKVFLEPLFHQLPLCPGFLVRLVCLRAGAFPPSDWDLWGSLCSVLSPKGRACTRSSDLSPSRGWRWGEEELGGEGQDRWGGSYKLSSVLVSSAEAS